LTAFNSPLLVAGFGCWTVCSSILDGVTFSRISIVGVVPFELPGTILVTISFRIDVRFDSWSYLTLWSMAGMLDILELPQDGALDKALMASWSSETCSDKLLLLLDNCCTWHAFAFALFLAIIKLVHVCVIIVCISFIILFISEILLLLELVLKEQASSLEWFTCDVPSVISPLPDMTEL
jgi:hypothetical protein